MDNRENATYKYIILAVAFMVTVVVTFISMNYETSAISTMTMTQATLPVVMMQTEEGQLFNRLYGYTQKVDASMMGETLTPLPTDKKLSVVVDLYGQELEGVSYKVRDLSDLSLIENTKVEDYTQDESRADVVLNIKNLIDNNKEYLLEVTISTKKQEEIYYYTRIISGTDFQVQDKLNYVLELNSYAYDQTQLKNLTQYLETTSSGDNSNFGKVNIHSKQSQVGWGELGPFIESDRIPSITQIGQETAEITIDYMVGAENDNNSYDTYRVKDYYKIRQSGSKLYLLDYEREAGQYFDGQNDFLSSSKINLGIQPDTDVMAQASDNGQYTAFVSRNTLWELDSDNSELTKVFSFDAEDSDNIRECGSQHEIRIMSVSDEGSLYFLICGYMSRGAHEGEMGISLCSYNYGENVVQEELYLPVDVSYESMEERIGGIAYVNDNNLFYILIDDTLYAINLISREVMTEVSGLAQGTYAVSKGRNMIAYSENHSQYDTDSIRIFNMQDGTDYTIRADAGEKLKVLGYINSDFIYGIADAEDIVSEGDGNTFFPMYQVNIMASDYTMQKEYNEPGIYVSNAIVDKLRVNLYRVVKNADGSFSETTMDQLINREENSTSDGLVIDTISTTNRKTEVILVLKKAISNVNNITVRYSDKMIFKKDETSDLLMKH